MKPSEVVATLETAARANQPTMLYGSPGIGKSDMVREVCKKLGYKLIDIRVSQLDPVDVRGIPTVVTRGEQPRTVWSLPSYWPEQGEKTCLFFDELNSGAPAVMAACYQIILDRELGEHKLPDNTIIFAAGNNITDGGLVNVMPTPLKNRMSHIDVHVDDDEWLQWANKNGIRPEVISLIRYKPTLLNEFERINGGAMSEASHTEDKRKKKSVSHKDLKAFATPRTWAFVSNLMNAEPDPRVAFQLYAGTVGEGAAIELRTHIEIHHKLPDMNLIVSNPSKAPVPGEDEPAVLYSLASSLASKATKKNFAAILKYSDRIPAEYAVTLVKDAVMRDTALCDVDEFKPWATNHVGVLL